MRSMATTAAWRAALAALWVLPLFASAQSDEAADLEAVRERITELERRLGEQTAARGSAVEALGKLERAISDARRAIERIDADTASARARADQLARDRAAAEARLGGERDALADQLRVTYVNHQGGLLKLLLSQESPADFGRMLVYYEYFHRARSERIEAATAEVGALARVEREAAQVAAELEDLRRARASELETLAARREEREAVIARLDAELETGGGELERLKSEEQRLAALVTELGNLLAGFPMDAEAPFPDMKGRLPWPVQGELRNRFGQARGGGVEWNGVTIAASRGTPVRAVYHGRVAYADWLPQLGLLLIIDHGDGYMSLYGHNDTLLRQAGDWVRPGDAIAEVGASGGRSEPSLYFEIRKDARPLDPAAWVMN